MLNAAQNLVTATAELAKLSTDQPATLDDLVALSVARDCIDSLFRSCTDELRSDPRVAPMWEAMAAAIKLQGKQGFSKPKTVHCEADQQVLMFWNAFADRFAWDFLPVDFLHALYAHWMAEQFPQEVAFSKTALTRRLKRASATSGNWFHTRARPGTLMHASEPLTARVPGWSHDGSDAAIYGLRRSGV
ncbi:hypothetical protein AOC05_17910 [Arthrobacter alpinus]|uniref:DNA primase/nucleoside triphosphatase C-terminal domain-containing protein n=1 Tax=Arthrobacter alpinus TaxID=656366 RepID=A0A0M3UH30_9MICC|nr:primase-like DNA-binding domain-containing protein [Arthrobacter alpinus]ALE93769.1 hypothetical protein AOC05_17910 [Arthrobacter alpinus]